MEDRLRESR